MEWGTLNLHIKQSTIKTNGHISSSSGLGHGKSVNEPIIVKGTSNLSSSVDPDRK
jgi:hypothetical protein